MKILGENTKSFPKTLHHRCLTGFWIYLRIRISQRSEYKEVLNIPGFWICQGSGYAFSSEYVRFSIYCGSKNSRVTLASEYAWTCLIMPEWLFVLHLPIVILFLNELKTVSLKSENLFFCIYSRKDLILFFCFRLNICTSKISNLPFPFGAEGARSRES